MKAKTFGILLIGLIIVGIAWNIFAWLANRPAKTSPSPPNLGGGPAETILSPGRMYFPSLVDNGQSVIGLVDLGRQFVRIDRASKEVKELMSELIDFAPDEASYAPNGTMAILHREPSIDEPSGRTTLYDFSQGTKQELNAGISQVAWLPDSQGIVYLFRDSPKAAVKLARAKPDATDYDVLWAELPIFRPKLRLSPDGQQLILWNGSFGESPLDPLDYPLYVFNLNQRQLTELTQTGVVDAEWSPDGLRLAYLRLNDADQLAYLAMLTLGDGADQPTNLSTIPGKFTWRNNNELIAASPDHNDPEDLIAGTSLATTDKIFRVSEDGQATELINIDGSPPLRDLISADDGKTLLFRRLETLVQAPLPE